VHIYLYLKKYLNIFICRYSASIFKIECRNKKNNKKMKKKMKRKIKKKKKKKVLWWPLLSKKLSSRVKVSQLGIYRCVSGPNESSRAELSASSLSLADFFFSSFGYWGLPGGTLGWWRWPKRRGVACLLLIRPSLKWQSNSVRWPKFDHVWTHEGQQHRESILEWSVSHVYATFIAWCMAIVGASCILEKC